MQHGFMDYYHLTVYNRESEQRQKEASEERLALQTLRVRLVAVRQRWQARWGHWMERLRASRPERKVTPDQPTFRKRVHDF